MANVFGVFKVNLFCADCGRTIKGDVTATHNWLSVQPCKSCRGTLLVANRQLQKLIVSLEVQLKDKENDEKSTNHRVRAVFGFEKKEEKSK